MRLATQPGTLPTRRRGHAPSRPRALDRHVLIPSPGVQAVLFHDEALAMPPIVRWRSACWWSSASTGMLRLAATLRLRLKWQVLDGSERELELCPDAGHGYSRNPPAAPPPCRFR